tara:strand:+ start:449 stop:1111 length:663 start_codon:yes stop_codon:yes gene_type:complete
MAEVGFGNPGSSSDMLLGQFSYASLGAPSITVYDQGFADKTALFDDFTHVVNSFSEHQTNTEYQFTGFGDPSPDFFQLPTLFESNGEFPDEGGVLITVQGEFKKTDSYFFQLVNKNGVVFPSATTYCPAAIADKGGEVISYQANTKLSFAMVPVPPGLYDLKMFYGQNKVFEITLPDFMLVIRKNRSSQVFSLRSKYPELFSVGARNFIVDRKDVGGTDL